MKSALELTRAASGPASAKEPNAYIAPYHTGLNGVNQPNNSLVRDMLWWSLGIAGMAILVIRVIELFCAQMRKIHAMTIPGQAQGYWKFKQWHWMPGVKKAIIYAPLWKKRHNREIRLSEAINMGTLPSRLQFVILALYIASNAVYLLFVDWRQANKYALCAEIRGRSGSLAVVNMVPLIIMAGRNNPMISMLQISFDTYNLLHRWMGRVIVLESMIHISVWAIVQVADGGWSSVWWKVFHDTFCASGASAVSSMAILLVLSLSPLRHAFYETFLTTHIALAFIIFVCTWIHCALPGLPGGEALPQLPYIITVMTIWFFDRLARMVRLAHCNWSTRGWTEAVVEPVPGEACRVTMHLPRFVDVKPGSHAYIRFAGVNFWENHPFSIAWVEHSYTDEVLPLIETDSPVVGRPVATTVSFVIGAHTGFTRKLYNRAMEETAASKVRAISLKAAFEGPYGGHHSMDSYGHAVLFAGATGITHQISYLRHIIQGYTEQTVATRRVTLVWVIRDHEALEWVRPWMDKVLRMENRVDVLRIKLFVTRPKNSKEILSPSQTVQIYPGRPNITTLLNQEVHEQLGAMCVTVCGPGSLADDVRLAVRKVQARRTVVDFVEESFSW